jgi:hypothetical protein
LYEAPQKAKTLELTLRPRLKPRSIDENELTKHPHYSHMRRLRATEEQTTIKLRNLLEYEFITSLYVGTHLQEMTFIIDTGSDLTWLPTDDCPKTQCPRDNYHYHKSSAFKKTTFMSSIKYVIGQAKGILMSDNFSLKRSRENTI